MADKKLLPKKTGDLSEWYTTVIRLAGLADYGPAKGSMIIKPYGYAIWEHVQTALDKLIKERGVDNVYFPLLIPMSFLEKEQSHVEGFAPELAVVTHGGGAELEEKLAVRPTSETIMYNTFASWVQSWRDLPILVNQWCNVVRWELRTMPFIRTSEFLWQEGHTAHASHEEAMDMQTWAMGAYETVYREHFALAGYVGFKSSSERFAGAVSTLTYESLMPSGKTLQSSTSHDLGQNFSKAFDISFQDKNGETKHAWQTSWGLSTRSIGGLINMHGDDNGLVLPPRLAPVQVIVVPVRAEEMVITYCQEIVSSLKAQGIRAKVDDRDDETFGFKLNKWEVKGVPIVLKIGGKEAEEGQVTAKRRFDGQEGSMAKDEFIAAATKELDAIHDAMLARSESYMKENTREAKTYEEFKQIIEEHKGFVKVYWEDNPEEEKRIKDETKAKTSCRPICFENAPEGVNFMTGKPCKEIWLFAQSY